MLERGTRFVQLFHWGWDQHGDNRDNDIRDGLVRQTKQTDQACTALIKDLKQRGMLEDTLIGGAGECGRTPRNEDGSKKKDLIGRDHHPHPFSIWMAGGGSKP